MTDRDFQIFISAVTTEFGKARDALAADLRSREATVRVESDFRQEAGADTTLKKLHDYVRDCSAVVFITGKRSGSFPPPASTVEFRDMLPAGFTRATYTQWEFFFARHYKKRLSIYIANRDHVPDEPKAIEGDDSANQAAFLAHITKEEGLDRSYFSTEDRLCRLVLKEDWPSKKQGASNVAVEVERLPFLADRQPQVWRICASVAERLTPSLPTHSIPALFVLASWEDDAVDMLHWRLTNKDGPEYCEFDASRDSPYWEGQRLSWPAGSTPDSFKKEFVASNLPYLRTALRISRQRRRPLYLRTLVGAAEIADDFQKFVEAWLSCWPGILDDAVQASTTDIRLLSSQQPVVGLLIVQFKKAARHYKRWQFWKPKEFRAEHYFRQLTRVSAGSEVEFKVLPPLSTVTFQNATEWLELPELLRHHASSRARDAIQHIFSDEGRGIPMEEFANAINSSQIVRQIDRHGEP
jgi:Domain of unknown function (DUF4062)